MSFVFQKYAPFFAIFLFVLIYYFYRYDKKYFLWVQKFWFFKRSRINILSSILIYCGLALLIVSALDPRGKSESIKASIPEQRTIVMIDNSASMLTEDIRPNRFVRSILMAKHFVKNAANHQISIVLFSDISKQVVPFTNDTDLLDSMLSGLEKLDLNRGGTNLSRALNEMVGYFGSLNSDNVAGNIVVFTDAEENGDKFEIALPEKINLALVGVGTSTGGKVPMRDREGRFQNHMKFNGEEVISKLDEGYLLKIKSVVKRSKVWIALSYTLPTDEILDFFRTNFKNDLSIGNVTIKPVLAHFLYIPGFVLLCLGYLFRFFSPYRIVSLVLIVFANLNVFATEVTADVLDKYKGGGLNKVEKLKIAESLLRANKLEESIQIYKENANGGHDPYVYFNYATALLKNGQMVEAANQIEQMNKSLANGDSSIRDELSQKIRANVLLSLKQEKNKDQKSKDEKSEDSKKDKGEQNNNKDNKEGSENKENKDKEPNKDKDGSSEKKDKKNGQTGDGEQKNGSKGKEDNIKDLEKDAQKNKQQDEKSDDKSKKDSENENKESDVQQGFSSVEEKEENIKDQKKLIKVPALLKQLLDDDRTLQEKFLDSTTQEKNSMDKKDW